MFSWLKRLFQDATIASNSGDIHLKRQFSDENSTQGVLSIGGEEICKILEGPDGQRINPGEYSLGLRTEGGRHATYAYNFKDSHKGMIWIQGDPNFPYAVFRMGYFLDSEDGSLVVADSFEENGNKLETTGSQEAYETLYGKLVDSLSDGEEVHFTVQ